MDLSLHLDGLRLILNCARWFRLRQKGCSWPVRHPACFELGLDTDLLWAAQAWAGLCRDWTYVAEYRCLRLEILPDQQDCGVFDAALSGMGQFGHLPQLQHLSTQYETETDLKMTCLCLIIVYIHFYSSKNLFRMINFLNIEFAKTFAKVA